LHHQGLTLIERKLIEKVKKLRADQRRPLAEARGFFQRKSRYDLKANAIRNHTATPPRSSERRILAFSRDRADELGIPYKEIPWRRGVLLLGGKLLF
jgi:hypothetical protein